MDKCPGCGAIKLAQDRECSQCARKHWELECRISPNAHAELQKMNDLLTREGDKMKLEIEQLQIDNRNLKDSNVRMRNEYEDTNDKNSVLITRIRRMENQIAITALALERD